MLQLLKSDEESVVKSTVKACKQVVGCLVENVLRCEENIVGKIANDFFLRKHMAHGSFGIVHLNNSASCTCSLTVFLVSFQRPLEAKDHVISGLLPPYPLYT